MTIVNMTRLENELQATLRRYVNQRKTELIEQIIEEAIAQAEEKIRQSMMQIASECAMSLHYTIAPHENTHEFRLVLDLRTPEEKAE